MSARKRKSQVQAYELVLGAGGVKGYGHVGVLKSIEKHEIEISDVIGVSVGSLIAAFYCNGYKAAEIAKILEQERFLEEGAQTVKRFQDAVTLKDLQARALTNLAPLMEKLVRKYELLPQDRLKVLAYNVSSLEPVLFCGKNYNLARALAASCSVPFVMRPVRERIGGATDEKVLVDGFLHHTHPSNFCKKRALVSKLGFASRLPAEWLPPAQMLLHFAELANCLLLDWFFEDPERKHILIESGSPDVATMSFSSSKAKCVEMIAYGERQADRILRKLK